MQKLKFSQAECKKKRKKSYLKVKMNEVVVNKEYQQFEEEKTKKSDQPMSRSLEKAWSILSPHLLYGSEMHDTSIMLDETIDERKWFNEQKYLDEERFQGVELTKIEFIGNNGILEGVKLWGHRTTQYTEKPFNAPLETPVLSLLRGLENGYKLVVVLDEQVQDVLSELLKWHELGETLTKAQLEADLA